MKWKRKRKISHDNVSYLWGGDLCLFSAGGDGNLGLWFTRYIYVRIWNGGKFLSREGGEVLFSLTMR